MASTEFHITAGPSPDDNSGDDGSTLFYITAGLPPDDDDAGVTANPMLLMNHFGGGSLHG